MRTLCLLCAVLLALAVSFFAISGTGDPSPDPEVVAPDSPIDKDNEFTVVASDCDTPITITVTWVTGGANLSGSPSSTMGSPNSSEFDPAGGTGLIKIVAADGALPSNKTIIYRTVQ